MHSIHDLKRSYSKKAINSPVRTKLYQKITKNHRKLPEITLVQAYFVSNYQKGCLPPTRDPPVQVEYTE